MKNGRELAVEQSANLVRNTLVSGKSIVEYVRKKNGQRKGVVVVFRDPSDNQVKFGWSLCNTTMDKFDRHIGLAKAIRRAVTLHDGVEVEIPHSMVEKVSHVIERADRFFNKAVS